MTLPQQSFVSNVIVGSPALAAETVICQVGPFPADFLSRLVILTGWCVFTVGTTGTAVRLRVHRNALGGTDVSAAPGIAQTAVAASVIEQIHNTQDTLTDGQDIYVLTLQVTGGSAVSTVAGV